ncbi:MAG: T9SS type A sorting domain-containing protein [Flavobacteriales bacterium]|nr:T9SS type A sorting domain-containing protein [Flavobacteriales bacterium]
MKNSILFLLFGLFALSSWSQDPCDDVEIVSVQLDPFSMTELVITVENTSSSIFDYPGFRIYDEFGELIGEEEVNFFGIGESSIHRVPHELLEVEAGASFNWTLELWTGFYSELACTFNGSFIIRPAIDCAEIGIALYQLEEESPSQGVTYSLVNDDNTLSFEGTFELGEGVDTQFAWHCLPSGCYTITFSPAGQLFQSQIGGNLTEPGMSWSNNEVWTMNTSNPSYSHSFSVWSNCDVPDLIEGHSQSEVRLFPNPVADILHFENLPENSRVRILSNTGRVERDETLQRAELNVEGLASGLYIVQISKDGYSSSQKLMIH